MYQSVWLKQQVVLQQTRLVITNEKLSAIALDNLLSGLKILRQGGSNNSLFIPA